MVGKKERELEMKRRMELIDMHNKITSMLLDAYGHKAYEQGAPIPIRMLLSCNMFCRDACMMRWIELDIERVKEQEGK